ncbi:MAG: hypothetical protein SGARI_000053 [Bacillariaceae sp.]
MTGIAKNEMTVPFCMTEKEKADYLNSQHGIDKAERNLQKIPEHFQPQNGHDVSVFLKQNANTPSRGAALVKTVREILDKDKTTKIVVFADGRIGAGAMAKQFLDDSGLGCTTLEEGGGADIRRNNELEDKRRPRVLVLQFDSAAGLNLQTECYNLILFTPLYVGDGGMTGDPVHDVSTEQQAIGRVYRPGQPRPQVNVFRLEMRGPNNERIMDGHLIDRNNSVTFLEAATNTADEE